MAICEYCGEKFKRSEAESDFNSEYGFLFNYENFEKDLCYSCASQAIEDEDDGVYFEVCDECGSTFDYGNEASNYSSQMGGDLIDMWNGKVLCCDCAINECSSDGDDED